MRKYYLGWIFLRRMLSQKNPLACTSQEVSDYPLPEETALRIVSPIGKSTGDIILLHGLSLKGHHDPRILKLAGVMASLGFKVWLPQLKEVTNHEIRLDVQERVDAVLQALKPHIAGPLAVMAPSYLGTVLLTLAATPQQYTKIDALCCIGVFGDFNRFCEQVALCQNEAFYGRAVFLKNLLRAKNRFSEAIHKVLEQMFANAQAQLDYMTGVDLQQLDPKDRDALNPLVEPGQWHTLEVQLLQMPAPALTLPACMKHLSTKFAFIHGEKDPLATVAELKSILPSFAKQSRRIAITSTMEHSHYLCKLYQLPALIRLANTFSFFFQHAMTKK